MTDTIVVKGKGAILLTCQNCNDQFRVDKNRQFKAKFCCRECSDKSPRERNYTRCRECGTLFPMKKSQEDRSKVWGVFCSKDCNTKFRSRMSLGENNPNYKGRNYDYDGYRLSPPSVSLKLGFGRVKQHIATALTEFGVKKFPKGIQVHHKDCNILNNEPWNLSCMTDSDHRWIHKQYGTATLAAVMRGDLDISVAASWSEDPLKAESLLLDNVVTQGELKRYYNAKGIDVEIGVLVARKPVIANLMVVSDLSETERGLGGLGSTGK
jgi:hypothetical protein